MSSNPLSPTSASKHDETLPAIPPRFWWLKRIGIGVAMLLLLLIALRLWWGAVAYRRLNAEIERIRAAGEPIEPADFDPLVQIPDAKNAAIVLQQAASSIATLPGNPKVIEDVLARPMQCRERRAEVAQLLAGQDAALAGLHAARALPDADWGLRIRSPATAALLPNFSGQRQLAKLACLAALYQHTGGDDRAAVESLRDLLAQARTVDQDPTLISHLVAIAISALACKMVEAVAPDLAIGDSRTDSPSGPAGRAQVSELIADLLDQHALHSGMIRSLQRERMLQLDSVRMAIQGGLIPANLIGFASPPPRAQTVLGWPMRPLFALDGVYMMDWSRRWIDAMRQENWPAARQVRSPESSADSWQKVVHPLSRILLPSLERAAHLHYRALASRRMAAIGLAIRIYQHDHGQRPETLEALVPDYLPVLPLDPLAADGRPIRYAPEAATPMLYCVGDNGIDEQGAWRTRGVGIDWDCCDIPFFLDGGRPEKPPEPAASTQAVENDGDVQHQQRNDAEQQQRQQQP